MIAQIHSFIADSQVNGPGHRAVVWFQGCNLGCSGCWNPDTHALGGKSMSTFELAHLIIDAARDPQVNGVTFSGGEPMQQAPALLEIVDYLRRYYPRLSIGMFSGYSEKELDTGNFSWQPTAGYELERLAGPPYRVALWKQIQARLDFAVLGRYNQLAPNSGPLTTSTNQKLALYSSHYTASDFDPQTVEVQIGTEGLVQITGFPVLGDLR